MPADLFEDLVVHLAGLSPPFPDPWDLRLDLLHELSARAGVELHWLLPALCEPELLHLPADDFQRIAWEIACLDGNRPSPGSRAILGKLSTLAALYAGNWNQAVGQTLKMLRRAGHRESTRRRMLRLLDWAGAEPRRAEVLELSLLWTQLANRPPTPASIDWNLDHVFQHVQTASLEDDEAYA